MKFILMCNNILYTHIHLSEGLFRASIYTLYLIKKNIKDTKKIKGNCPFANLNSWTHFSKETLKIPRQRKKESVAFQI